MTKNLDELRAQIDVYDNEITALLKKRYEATDAIGHIKIALALPIPHPTRQQHRRDLLVALAQRHGLEHGTLAIVYEGINGEVVTRHRRIAEQKAG